MNRHELLIYLSVLAGVGSIGLAEACSSLSPYPGEDPTGVYEAGYQIGTTGGGPTPTDGGVLGDGEVVGDGDTDGSTPPPLCTGCTLVATAEDPQGIALDPDNIYWTQGVNTGKVPNTGTGSVMTEARPGGGAPTAVASGLTGPIIIAYANSYIGWSAYSGAMDTPGQSSVSLLGGVPA